jgi:hypothetical protein
VKSKFLKLLLQIIKKSGLFILVALLQNWVIDISLRIIIWVEIKTKKNFNTKKLLFEWVI